MEINYVPYTFHEVSLETLQEVMGEKNKEIKGQYLGAHNPFERKIYLLEGMPNGQAIQVLAHEITHAVIAQFGNLMPNTKDDGEEALCDFVGGYYITIEKIVNKYREVKTND